ncbi:MAG: tyrosine-type recombinase/integrase [Pleomorphochaeta sp.]
MTATPFTLCRIKNKENFSFYVMYRDPITNKRGTKKSIDKLKRKLNLGFEHVTRLNEANIIAQKALDNDIIFTNHKEKNLKKYLLKFFDYEKSPYFSRKLLLDKDSISPDYVSTRRNLIINHLLPLIDDSFSINNVNINFLEDIQTKLIHSNKLSSTTINQIMNSFSQALEYAKKDNLIKQNQFTKVDPIRKNIKVRGILTNDEISKVISHLKTQQDKTIYLAVSLALITGMRSGELRALTKIQIKNGIIIIDRAYANIAKNKIPKGKKTRIVPCPIQLCESLIKHADNNLNILDDRELVFWSKKKNSVISSHYFSTKFKEAIIRSETLTKEEIESRNISFHSLRHMANTLLRGSVDEYILRLTIGHSTEQLSDIYSHIEDNALESIRKAQETNILPFIN